MQDQDNDDLYQDENVEESSSIGNENESLRNNTISNFIKDPLTTVKNGFDKFFSKNKKRKAGFSLKQIWKRIPLKVKIILVLIIFLIIAIVSIIKAIEDNSTKEAVTTRNEAIEKLNISNQVDSSNLSEIDQSALDLYNNYDSLIAFTTEQLNSLYEEFLSNDSNENKYLLETGVREFGDENGDMYTYNYKRTLYEHILRTEKYNFNKIVWKGFTHNEDNVDLETEYRDNLELIIPKGIDDKTLTTLFKTTAPYLLTQDIPLGALCGMVAQSNSSASVDASTAQNFVYQIIKESLTKITMHKYELDTIKYDTTYDDYTYNTYTQVYYVNQYSNGYEELVSEEQPVLESKSENEVTPEVKLNGTEEHSYDIYWYPSEAITYDAKIKNNFNYTKYNDSDVQNIKNPDSNTLIESTIIDELYQEISSKSINQSVSKPVDKNGNPESPTATNVRKEYKYIKKEGYTYIYEKTWSDKLTPQSTDYEKFDFDTAKEYNTSNNDTYSNFETDKTLFTEEEFSEKDTSIFNKYTEEDTSIKLYGMSIIDLLDSNSGIYNKYLNNGGNVSEFEGIGRVKLKAAYNQIKNALNSLAEKVENDGDISGYNFNTNGDATDKTLPFVYGASLGYAITDLSYSSSTSVTSTSSMDLLRMFIHSFEGDGSTSGGGMYDENQIKTNDETKAKYYKVYDAKDDVYTVGYGVNINANFNKVKEALAEVGVTINSLADIHYGMLLDKSAIDKVSDIKIQDSLDIVASETQGLDLTEYQIHALASRAYVHGTTSVSSGSSAKPFKTFYEQYWNEETDDQYETLYEQYKDNQTATQEIVSKVNFNHGLFTNFLDIYVSPTFDAQYPGYENRQRAEFTLFSTGYYSPLQTFYRKGGVSPGDVQLLDSSGNVDIAACLELQMWFEENIFGNNIHAGTNITPGAGSHSINLDPSIGSGQWYSAKTLEYAKKVEGGPHFEYKGHSGYRAYGENGLGIFQCTWWAQSRATLYLTDNGWTGSYIGDRGALGDGGQVAENVHEQYGIPLNTDINNIRANSIASFSNGPGTGTGHVVYIEAVGNDYYVISHCGSGHSWFGVDIIPKGSNVFYRYFNGSVCMDDML